MADLFIVISYCDRNETITDVHSERKWAKVTATLNPSWRDWNHISRHNWVRRIRNWLASDEEARGQAPKYPTEPKAYIQKLEPISRERAKFLIAEYGLERVHSDRDGTIYDSPDKDFQRQFKKIIQV